MNVPETKWKIKLFYLTYIVRWEKFEFLKAKNKISSLDSASFVHNVKLSHLSLNENQLQLPYVTWLTHSKNMNIQLDGNPWICDCITLRFINSFLDQKHSAQTVLNKMTCAEPEELKGWLNFKQIIWKKIQIFQFFNYVWCQQGKICPRKLTSEHNLNFAECSNGPLLMVE